MNVYKKNTYRKVFSLIITLFMIISVTFNVIAHSTLQSSIIDWGESIGWSIDEGYHTNSATLYYRFDPDDNYLTDTYKTMYRNGAAKWSSYGTVTEKPSAIGVVCTFSDSGTTIVGVFYDYYSNSSDHLTAWKIKINRAKYPTSVTVAHEFGHAYGLNDLYNSTNKDKLMYGYENRTATSPMSIDGKGFKVITGAHASHTWKYKQIPGYPPYVPMHYKYCSVCDGYKNEGCSPLTGKCSKCGYYH